MLDGAHHKMAPHALTWHRIAVVTLAAVALSACGGGSGSGSSSSQSSSGSSQTVSTAAGDVMVHASAGTLGNVQVAAAAPAGAPTGISTPFGWFTFDITGLTSGASVTLTFTVPSGFTLTGYEKCNSGSCSALSGATVSGSTLMSLCSEIEGVARSF